MWSILSPGIERKIYLEPPIHVSYAPADRIQVATGLASAIKQLLGDAYLPDVALLDFSFSFFGQFQYWQLL